MHDKLGNIETVTLELQDAEWAYKGNIKTTDSELINVSELRKNDVQCKRPNIIRSEDL